MSDSPKQEKESAKQKKYKDISGLVFVGCVVIGMGISFAINTMPVGLFIGVGVGFLMMALIRHRTRNL
jgi:Na+-transporting NADH:ubiquinone oxidoreductase subunit NqrD